MIRKLKISILVFILVQPMIIGQTQTYTISKTSFSTDKNDEFCPVFYSDGLVFTSNSNVSSITQYFTAENGGVFNIHFTVKSDDGTWSVPEIFAKDIRTRYNDGPCTFTSQYDTIYYSRNLNVEGKLSRNAYARNKLGLFYAIRGEDGWGNVRDMRVNNEWYNVTTPFLSPDGQRLYFSSDYPEGYGGMDLYYLPWEGRYWGDPVNLGPEINTKGSESYPFVNQAGELFFTSDGHGGLGGKDIFYTRFAGDEWISPVHIDAPINSEDDDFGLIADPLMHEGYFSSNRDGSVDIFYFETLLPQVFHTDIQKENQYCFVFEDTGSVSIDTSTLEYVWAFSDGVSETGSEIIHCFPGPGDYNVRLNIVEKTSARVVSLKLEKTIHLRDFKQAYIDSPDCGIIGEELQFSGLKSNLPGYEILDYAWDFGDGTRKMGPTASHVYSESGVYKVNLGLELKSDSTGKLLRTGISKEINVFGELQHKTEFKKKLDSTKSVLVDILNYQGAEVKIDYSVEEKLDRGAVFRVELFSSENRIVNNRVLRDVPSKYTVDEVINSDSSSYSYYIEWQMDFMSAYNAYREMIDLGFDEAEIKAVVLTDPPEKDLYNLRRIYGSSADKFFGDNSILTSHALIMLDQVVSFLNRYRSIRLEIGVHTDSQGTSEANMDFSQERADAILDYLINRGIKADRLTAVGYGEIKPIAPNYTEQDRKKNRRVELRIVND